MAELKRVCPKCFAPLRGRVCTCGFVGAPGSDYAMALPNYVLLSGRYILLHVIGAGGFGVTYKALDRTKNRIYAIKEYMPVGVALRRQDGFVHPDTASKTEIFEHGKNRFMEEAFFLQKLNYMPATARITDCFEENGTAYFVMEYINGTTIKQQVSRRGPFALPEALNIISAAATALDRIHTEVRIFHRDISPENIMLTETGVVKILDFGSAKQMAKQAHQNFTVVLKAGYAPPEQYSSNTPQGAYTDVYAMASTFYYMVTGEKVPPAPSRIDGKTYTPLKCRMSIPEGISDAVDRALRLNRQERTATCAQFARELQNAVGGVSANPPAAQRAQRPAAPVQQQQRTPVLPQRPAAPKMQPAGMAGVQIRTKTVCRRENIRPNTMYCVGRNPRCDLVLPEDMMLSNQHMYLYYDQAKKLFAVKDISRNGVVCGTTRLIRDKFYYLRPGVTIKLAGVCDIYLIGH